MPFPKTPDPHSILLMGFGQSNADVHDAGPRLAIEVEDAMPIFMPNDGKMIRGYMGKHTRVTPHYGLPTYFRRSPDRSVPAGGRRSTPALRSW